ncbi:MAG: VirB3 family type IV secretion system protein [Alphaproteobacteria bacterium]|jgi:type IV secretory pathway VirB3-like protein|nr:VirB3 family type IV secretion system protein [Alphaproteobacteria bacterium]
MRQQVLKALANPAHIFYVPYSLAILNFVVQFIVFIAIFTIRLITTGNDTNPLYFMGSVILVHSIIAIFSKRDPQLGQIISSKLNLFTKKVPRKLAA